MRSVKLSIKLALSCLLTAAFLGHIQAQTLLNPKTQPQFVNPLPIPPVIDATSPTGDLTLSIQGFKQWLGVVDQVTKQPLQTPLFGYNGIYPGPTIMAKKNRPVNVFFNNDLVDAMNNPLPHFLPVDPTLDWALKDYPNWRTMGVPTVTHLHGGHTEPESDGAPEAWYTPKFAVKGSMFMKGDMMPYHYDNDQDAATLWYHDHTMGLTRLNAYAGLAGFYLITDENEAALKSSNSLPASPYDIGLAIQDKMFTAAGDLYYPANAPVGTTAASPSAQPEFFGDCILVNGMLWPVLDVEPRQYRFRLLNASDSRFYNLSLSTGTSFSQISSDDGLLPAPVNLKQTLIAPGERKDIIIDFSSPDMWGKTIIMNNNAKAPYPSGAVVDPATTGKIMAFRVKTKLNSAYPPTKLGGSLTPAITPLTSTLAPRKLILFETTDQFGRLKPSLGTVANGVMKYMDPVTENPMLNTTEIWEIYNETMDAHPIHLHLVKMQLIDRQRFKATVDPVTGAASKITMVGKAMLPPPEEQGWKDTWVMYPGEVTRVIATFDRPGMYVWHCHIISHEDNEMMRPLLVGTPMLTYQQNAAALSSKINLKTFPNPFSNSFTVRFNLKSDSKVSIRVFDAIGNLVKVVFDGRKQAGPTQFEVGENNWSNGMYFCVIDIDGQRIVQKLSLQK